MGMPCAHRMQERLQENGTLMLDDIHWHWHLTPPLIAQVEPLVLEPAIAVTCGRPAAAVQPPQCQPNRVSKARIATSTRREPSAFERLELPTRVQTWSQRNVLRSQGGEHQDI
jgi:hypothetical protein